MLLETGNFVRRANDIQAGGGFKIDLPILPTQFVDNDGDPLISSGTGERIVVSSNEIFARLVTGQASVVRTAVPLPGSYDDSDKSESYEKPYTGDHAILRLDVNVANTTARVLTFAFAVTRTAANVTAYGVAPTISNQTKTLNTSGKQSVLVTLTGSGLRPNDILHFSITADTAANNIDIAGGELEIKSNLVKTYKTER